MVQSLVGALSILGFSAEEEQTYRQVLPRSGQRLDAVAHGLERDPDALLGSLARFIESGMGTIDVPDRVVVVPPGEAIAQRIRQQTEVLRRATDRIEELRGALPKLPHVLAAPEDGGAPLGGELRTGHDVPLLLESWIRQSAGDLMWLRPDQWRLPAGSAVDVTVTAALQRGRRSRAIYPARALEEAPQVIFQRASAGEEVRIIAEVPSRLAIVGEAGALLPAEWGSSDDRRLVVREPGLLTALTVLFDELWDRAIVVPGVGVAPDPVAISATMARTMLLRQLSQGAKDEQIARSLGISLRTVRRRMADLFEELGVESRFQAGVEAVRRGWI
jgi:hypothetical protein